MTVTHCLYLTGGCSHQGDCEHPEVPNQSCSQWRQRWPACLSAHHHVRPAGVAMLHPQQEVQQAKDRAHREADAGYSTELLLGVAHTPADVPNDDRYGASTASLRTMVRQAVSNVSMVQPASHQGPRAGRAVPCRAKRAWKYPPAECYSCQLCSAKP
jgi:hypothetical protein